MTPQELKNSLLLQAVNGRIVHQCSDDEPAEIFVNSIRRKQKQMLNAGQIKREKYNQEIVNNEELPDGWCYVKLGELTTVVTKQTGFDYSASIKPNLSEVKLEGMIPMVQTKNFKGRNFDYNTDYYIPVSIAKQFPKIMLDSQCLLLSIVGASIGNIGIYDGETKGIIGGAICKVTLIDNRLYEYLYIYLQSPLGQQEIKKNLKATAQGTITVQDVREIVIKMPPLAEQKRIVAKVEDLLPLIDQYEKAWSRLEEFNKQFPGDMQKSILQMAIQGKLVEQRPGEGSGAELYQQIQEEKQVLSIKGEVYRDKSVKPVTEDCIPFDIPESWFWCRLGDLTRLITKGSSPAWQGVSYTDEANGILFITSENVGDNTMLLNKRKYVEAKFNLMHPSSILKKNDILTNLVGASIGRSALFDDNSTNANINQAVCIIRLVNNSVSDFIRIMLRSEAAIRMMLSDTVDTARANLSLASVSNLLIPLPPLAEQKRIVEKIEKLMPLSRMLKK